MKQGIHPETYRLVAFKDMSNDQVFMGSLACCSPCVGKELDTT